VKFRLAAAVITAAAALSAAVPAAAAGHGKGHWTTCKPFFRRTISGPWGAYIIRDDVFTLPGLATTICIRHQRGTPAFAVSSSDAASPGPALAYPEVFYGCVYGACSPGTILPSPLHGGEHGVSAKVRKMSVSVFDKARRKGKFDTGFDIWLTPDRQTGGQATGAEVMIWLREQGVRFTPRWRVRAGGIWWLAEEWRTCHSNGLCWPLIIFLREHQHSYARKLPLMPFFAFGEHHGWIRKTFWLESVEHGFEIWSGGTGLACTFFRVFP